MTTFQCVSYQCWRPRVSQGALAHPVYTHPHAPKHHPHGTPPPHTHIYTHLHTVYTYPAVCLVPGGVGGPSTFPSHAAPTACRCGRAGRHGQRATADNLGLGVLGCVGVCWRGGKGWGCGVSVCWGCWWVGVSSVCTCSHTPRRDLLC